MVIRLVIAILGLWVFWAVTNACGQTLPVNAGSVQIRIQSVAINGRPVSWRAGEELQLPPIAENLSFRYGFTGDSSRAMRLRYKLEGYDQTWREGPGEMYLAIRFLDDAGEQLTRKSWKVSGESPGWSGDLATATFNHRTETVVVPPGATHIRVMITSAGPPATVGIYVVDDLVVSKLPSSGGPATVLIRTPFSQSRGEVPVGQNLTAWERQGTRPSMARIVEIGRSPVTRALAILDEDPRGHAEWDSLKATSPHVNPGDQLLVEWNEVYSIGWAIDSVASYEKLPQGIYRFCVAEATVFGRPTGAQELLSIRVPLPVWRTSWFWAVCVSSGVAVAVAIGRYLAWRRVRQRMLLLQQERAVEQERLRIARNIHDDLGARITQVSLLSGVSQNDPQFPPRAQEAFGTVSTMCRDLVSALYETVWAVAPENDNLEALGTYLGQMVEQLTRQANLHRRLHLLDLPPDVEVSSHTRHHVTLAVKEAVHNVIKHARASELTLCVAWSNRVLTVSVQDDGRGIPSDGQTAGHGVANMKRRLSELGGTCTIQSRPGRGTTVEMRLELGQS